MMKSREKNIFQIESETAKLKSILKSVTHSNDAHEGPFLQKSDLQEVLTRK